MSMRTKEFRLLLTILFTLLGMQVKAEDRVVIQSAEISAGDKFYLPIELVNEVQYKGFQMDIELPNGISPVYNPKGKIAPTKTDRLEESHTFSYNVIGNVVKLVCTSMSGDTTWGNSGTLFSIELKADDNLWGGVYDIKLTGIKFTDENNIGHTFENVSATLTVEGSTPPAPTTYSYQFVADGTILSSGELEAGVSLTAPEAPEKTGYTFSGWNPEFTGTMPEADVVYNAQYTTNNYLVTFTVEGTMVSMNQMPYGTAIVAPDAPSLPGKEFISWNPTVPATVPAYDVNFVAVYEEVLRDTVYIQSSAVNAGDTFTLPVSMVNKDVFVGFQMDIVLPQGVSPVVNQKGNVVIRKTERLEDSHSFSTNYLEESNIVKLVCTSMASDEIYGYSGDLFTVDMQTAKNMAAGTYTISLTNVKFTTSSSTFGGAQGLDLDDAYATITVSNTSNLDSLKTVLRTKMEDAKALLDTAKIYGEVRTQINDAIQRYMNADDVNTLEEAISVMGQLLDDANSYIQIYAQLATELERLNGVLEDNGVRDPQVLQEAQTFYNSTLASWNAETITMQDYGYLYDTINNYFNLLNKVALTIHVEQSGTLANLISQQVDNYNSVVSLTVTGSINSSDVSTINSMNNLVSLNMEETNLTSLGSYSIYKKSYLKTVVLPKNLETIEEGAFYADTSLENITFPATLKTIGSNAFYCCWTLTKVVLPEGFMSLGYASFSYCNRLQEVILPSTVTTVDRAFLYSNALTKISCKAIIPPYTGGYLMDGNENLCTLEVPVLSIQDYKDNYYWNMFNIVAGSYYGDNMAITSEVTLNADDETLQSLKPSINVTKANSNWNLIYGALRVEGTNTLSLTNYEMFFDAYRAFSEKWWGYDYRYSATLINQAPMRADNVSVKLNLNSYQWYFICMPFDVKVSTITPNRDTQFVIYKYDGRRRGEGDMANTWVKMTADSTLQAGIGYIWQTASAYEENYGDYYEITFTLNALNTSNKNNIFRHGDTQVKLNEYLSELPHNRSWNLVGNPYPAYFNSRAMDINAPFTVWNVNNQNYEAFSPVDDGYIFAPGEAFFIQRPADQATIPFLAAGRQENASKSDIVFFNNARQSEMTTQRSVFNLLLQLDNKTVDRTRIVVNNEAVLGYESDKDAAKFEAMSKVSQLYTLEGGQRYAINERPIDRGQMQLGAEFAIKATYTLALETTAKEKVYLIDRLTGAEVLLNEGGYTFDAKAGIANDRFLVRIATDETTGIKNIDSLNSEGTYYDLRGVRVEKPNKGLYINNGKKTVVK